MIMRYNFMYICATKARGTLHEWSKSGSHLVQKFFHGCPEFYPNCSKVISKLSPSGLQVVSKLSPGDPKIVSKLTSSCFKSCLKVCQHQSRYS